MVVGKALVERLDVELGDDLLLTLTRADGEMEYAMLRIVGIVSTGSRTIDETICHATLADVEKLTGLKGVAEVSVAFADPQQVAALSAELAQRVQGDEVLTWREVLPAMGGDEAADRAFSSFFIVVVAAVVILGVTSAQLTAMLERRREFAVLMALGLGERKLVGLVLFEAVFMGALGALLGLLLALPLVWHTATAGIDFSAAMGDEMTVMGVFFDPIIYADMGLWMLPYAFGLGLCATLLAALYPAWSATRLDPAAARGMRDPQMRRSGMRDMDVIVLVAAQGVKKVFRTGDIAVEALRGIDLEIGSGEFMAIVGPSGSGKTTLLNLIGALDVPTDGRIVLFDRDLGPLSRSERAELRLRSLGFVFQAYNLVPVLTARENVEFVLELQGMDPKKRRARAEETLAELGLGELADRRPSQMSGGQQQRVAVARAVASRPGLVLADEPTANLDSDNAQALLQMMRRLRDEMGMTFVFSTHDPLVISYASRVVTLRDGEVLSDERKDTCG